MSPVVKAGTHSGSFHADDVKGGSILLTRFENVEFVRTRDLNILNQLPIVFDVGGEYAPDKGRYDHHQKGGAGARQNGIPYAASGLLWKEFGLDVVRKVASDFNLSFIDLVARVDRALIQQIDAHDCGVSMTSPRTLTYARAIELLNDPAGSDPAEGDADFLQACKFAEVVLRKTIGHEAAKMKTAAVIKDLYQGGAVLELPSELPWEEVVIDEMPDVRLVIVPKKEQFNLKTVPLELGAFDHRQLLPAAWAGLKGEQFSALTGIKDALFCHNGRFIAVASSLEGARALASQALDKM